MPTANLLPLSDRVHRVQSPVIPDVAALIRATPGTISLGQGVVHYPPPKSVFDAVAAFGRNPTDHVYHAASGLAALQERLIEKVRIENDIAMGEDQILMITAGSNMGFLNCVLAIADPGDEFLFLSPFFFNHEMAVVMANCRPVVVATDANFQPQLDRIEASIGPRTRAVVTVSPNNPSGAVYDSKMLTAINRLCGERGIYHISDEAYEYFTYEEAKHFSPGSLADSPSHTISLYSFSKSYGMASWRVGYLVAPQRLLPALQKIQDTVLICPPAISQMAAVGALTAGPNYCRPYIEALAKVRRSCLDHFADIEDVCHVPATQGAFYLLMRLESQMQSMVLVERLIRDFQVAAIPGNAFGTAEGCYIRIAYGALKQETVAVGMDRLLTGLNALLRR